LRKRIWWCPIGALSSIPLHAAGIYEGPAQDHVGNYAISSYIPTIATLYRLLTEVPIQSTQSVNQRMLLVAQPASNGLASLAHVATEIEQIKGVIPPAYSVNLDSDQGQTALVGDALDGMKLASIVHFACHGHHDRISPLDSGFELEDGRLTLRQLMHLKNPKAQLAYLSACDMAGMDESRPDECLNLVGSMICMGFRSVVGTMW
jgi:CHAT domain-containing protein